VNAQVFRFPEKRGFSLGLHAGMSSHVMNCGNYRRNQAVVIREQ
jgi:hypothetical protein